MKMAETEQRRAAAEGVLDRIHKREWHQLDLLLDQTADAQFWADVLRYELDLSSLSRPTGILERDKVIRELVEIFGVRSISAFHYSGVKGALRVIRKGLQFRMNVDFGLGDGATVLHLATFAGKLETVVQLVDDFRANVNAEDRQRRRPLHYACAAGHKEIAEFLMQRGADVGARDAEGATAAYRARQHSRHAIVSCLLEFYGDGDILLLEEEADSRRSIAPVYASLCRHDAGYGAANDARANGDGKDNAGRGTAVGVRPNGGYAGVVCPSDLSVPAEIQRKGKIVLKPIRRQGLKLDYEDVDMVMEEKHLSSALADQEVARDKRGISDENKDIIEVSDVTENSSAGAGQQYLTVGINSQPNIKANRYDEGTSYRNNKTDVKFSGYRRGEYEEIDFVEGESSLTVFGKDSNALRKPSRTQVPEAKSGTGLKVPRSDGQGGYRDGTNDYEELPDELTCEGNEAEAKASVSVEPMHSHRKRTCRSPYEEINLPEDNNSQVELDKNVERVAQSTGILKAKTNLKERCVASSPSGFKKRPHLYEQINLPEDEPNEGNLPVKSTAQNKTDGVSYLPNVGFRTRPHQYEEIELSRGIDAESQTEDRSNDELESKVRSLLRTELRTLLPLRCNRITAADSAPSSRPTSTFVRDFSQTGTFGEDADSTGRCRRFEDVVTVRQLRRIVREEIRLFGGCVQSIEVSTEFSDECLKHFNMLDKSRNSDAANHCLQEEEEQEGEKEGEKDEEKVCFELTEPKHPIDDADISHNNENLDVGKNNNCDNKGNVSSQSKPQDRSLVSILCSPGHFRRTFFNRKKDSSKQTNVWQAEPIEPPSMKSDAATGSSDPTTRTERSLRQPEDGRSSTAGQSQFYVRLDAADALLSTDT